MAMNRIDDPSVEVHNWFVVTYGQPQRYFAVMKEPTRLGISYKWASGEHRSTTGRAEFYRSIWCDDEIYAWYVLRWK